MIMTSISSRVRRWPLGGLIAAAALLLPLATAQAQDFNAVERRLGAAIEAGELSLEQAQIMMDALRRASRTHDRHDHGHRGGDDPLHREYERAEAKLKRMVEAGEITKEDAVRRLESLKRDMGTRTKWGEQRQRRVAIALSEAGVPRESIREMVDVIQRVVVRCPSPSNCQA